MKNLFSIILGLIGILVFSFGLGFFLAKNYGEKQLQTELQTLKNNHKTELEKNKKECEKSIKNISNANKIKNELSELAYNNKIKNIKTTSVYECKNLLETQKSQVVSNAEIAYNRGIQNVVDAASSECKNLLDKQANNYSTSCKSKIQDVIDTANIRCTEQKLKIINDFRRATSF